MKLYYRAVTQNGKPIQGFIDSKDEHEAASYLQKHQLVPIKIIEAEAVGIKKYLRYLKRPSSKDVIFFTRQLSSMLTSGLTLMQSLTIMRDQMKTSAMADTVQNIVVDVENGKTLSSGIEKYPQIFSAIYIALIKTGEASGLLDKVLTRLADNLEKQDTLRQTIRGALMYPIIVIIMMIVVTIIMMIFVIPQLSVLYGNLNIELPVMTQIVVSLSDVMSRFWPLIPIVVIGVIYLFQRWYRQEVGRKIVDAYVLKLPIFGKLITQSMMSEFSRTFGLLIGSGSLVVDSLLKSAEVVGNVHYEEAIVMVAKRVEKGITVSDAFGANPYFPPYIVQMSKIGEQTGKLDDALLRTADYYEKEVNQTVKTLTTLMEPLIMVLLALGVGFLIIAVITPIYSLLSTFQ